MYSFGSTQKQSAKETNRRNVREFCAPQVQKVMDYTKNISQSIFSPQCGPKEFHNSIPPAVMENDRKRRTKSVRMHTYRGTTMLYHGYDPSEGIPYESKSLRVSQLK